MRPIQIRLPRLPSEAERDAATNEDVRVYAPGWVRDALQHLGLQGQKLNIRAAQGTHPGNNNDESYTASLPDFITPRHLFMLTLNESEDGKYLAEQYPDIPFATLITLYDLAKFCVVLGKSRVHIEEKNCLPLVDETREKSDYEAYLCYLKGVQFQQQYNIGRLLLIPCNQSAEDDLPAGKLDNFIFKTVVHEAKASRKTCELDTSGRYLKVIFFNNHYFLDLHAYAKFVAQDFILMAVALNNKAKATEMRREANINKYKNQISINKKEQAQLEKKQERLRQKMPAADTKEPDADIRTSLADLAQLIFALETSNADLKQKIREERLIKDKINYKFTNYGFNLLGKVFSIEKESSKAHIPDTAYIENCVLNGILQGLQNLSKEDVSHIVSLELPFFRRKNLCNLLIWEAMIRRCRELDIRGPYNTRFLPMASVTHKSLTATTMDIHVINHFVADEKYQVNPAQFHVICNRSMKAECYAINDPRELSFKKIVLLMAFVGLAMAVSALYFCIGLHIAALVAITLVVTGFLLATIVYIFNIGGKSWQGKSIELQQNHPDAFSENYENDLAVHKQPVAARSYSKDSLGSSDSTDTSTTSEDNDDDPSLEGSTQSAGSGDEIEVEPDVRQTLGQDEATVFSPRL